MLEVVVFLKNLLYYLFIINIYLAALGLRCRVCALSSCGEWGLLFVALHGLLLLWNVGPLMDRSLVVRSQR